MCERAPPAKGKRSLPAGYQRPVLFLLIRGAAAQVFDQRRAALGVIALVQGFGEVEGMRRLLAARRVEQAIEGVAEEMAGSAGGMTGQIRIGAPDGAANFVLPQVCARIGEANPDLEVQIVALPRVFNLTRREADMVVAVSPPTAGRLSVQRITDYRLHLAASRRYLRDHAPITSLDDLKGHRMVGYIQDMIFDKELDYMREAALERVSLASNSVSVQVNWVRQGGGIGVLATDALIAQGGTLAALAPETLQALDARLPATWSHGNPVDIVGDAPGSRYAAAAEILAADPGVDAVLALNCPTAIASSEEAAQALIECWGERREPMLITSWVGAASAEAARRRFAAAGIPSPATPEQAVRAFEYLIRYQRSQELLTQVPPSVPESFAPDPVAAQRLLGEALAQGRDWLTPPEVKALLDAYGIPRVAGRVAATAEAAAEAALALGGKVALKIISAQIQHKSDVGGVVLDLSRPETVAAEAAAMAERVRELRPEAHLDGFLIEPMIDRRNAWELILGATLDPQFGPVLLFGQGGTAVEVVRDQSLELPPLNLTLARALIERTRVARLLHGFRDRPAADLDALALTLLKVAQLVVDLPQLVEIDINPLLADGEGVLAVDTRVRIAPATGSGAGRLAIRPYPRELEEALHLADGRELLLRPIRPEDEPALRRAFADLTPEQRRTHFSASLRTVAEIDAARFTQIDYDRDLALVVTVPGNPGRTPISGIVRILIGSDQERAEFAILLHPAIAGQGLGRRLLERIIAQARQRGLAELHGQVARDNRAMRRLAAQLGFVERPEIGAPELIRVTLALEPGR